MAIIKVDAQVGIVIVVVDATESFFESCRGASVFHSSSSSKIVVRFSFELGVGSVKKLFFNRCTFVIECDIINIILIFFGINGISIKSLKTLSVQSISVNIALTGLVIVVKFFFSKEVFCILNLVIEIIRFLL